jgi:hypothetical protein
LKEPETALKVLGELGALLDPHLATEEAEVIPFLREAKDYPAPPSDVEADLLAQGFAWSSQGIAPEVLDRVCSMLPAALRTRVPAARAAFEARCMRVWETVSAGASVTSVPEP